MEKLYHISDTLQKLIDWDSIYKMEREVGGHDEQMKGLFKGAEVIAHWNEGSYQGMVATCVKLPDGRFVAYNDYYGSCSGCDDWVDATDEEVHAMCINLANGAYIFKSLHDVMSFLSQDSYDSYSWDNDCAKQLLGMINVYLFFKQLKLMGFMETETNHATIEWFGFKVRVFYSDNQKATVELVGKNVHDGSECGMRSIVDVPDCSKVTGEELIAYLNAKAFKPSFDMLDKKFAELLSNNQFNNMLNNGV